MTVINLLPWREEARQKSQKKFLVLLMMVIGFTLLLCLLIHLYLNAKLSKQLMINQLWEEEFAKENTKFGSLRTIKKNQLLLLQNIKYLYELRENDYLVVRLLNELAKVVPDTIVLTSIQRVRNSVTVSGISNSSLQVTTFMENLSKVPFFHKPNIEEIISKDTDPQLNEKRNFKLTFQPLI